MGIILCQNVNTACSVSSITSNLFIAIIIIASSLVDIHKGTTISRVLKIISEDNVIISSCFLLFFVATFFFFLWFDLFLL